MSGTDEFIPDSDPQDAAPAEPVDAVEFDPAIVEKATRYGYHPKETSRDPSRWVPPDRFLELTSTQLKIMRDENAELRRATDRAEAMARNAADMARRQANAAAEERIAAIRAEKLQAVEASDVDRFKELEEIEQRIARPQPEQQPVPPEVAAYRDGERGKWMKDQVLLDFAINAINRSADAKKLAPMEQIEWAEQQTRKYYPHLFKAEPEPPRDATTGRFAKVDGGGLAGGRKGPNLSAEDMAQINQLVAKGHFKDADEAIRYSRKIGVIE